MDESRADRTPQDALIYNNFVKRVEFSLVLPVYSSGKRTPVAADLGRVAVAAHYVIACSDPGRLGHIRLNKILWHADLEHYRRAGRSLTGLTQYSRVPQGPFSAEISRAVGLLVRQGKVSARSVETSDFVRREMISLRDPDTAALGEGPIGIVDHMIGVVTALNAAQLLEMTRADPLWQEIAPGGAMVVSTGSIITKPLPLLQAMPAPARYSIAAE